VRGCITRSVQVIHASPPVLPSTCYPIPTMFFQEYCHIRLVSTIIPLYFFGHIRLYSTTFSTLIFTHQNRTIRPQ
jgi:hypothetical protein